jgi:hypothetical protein
MDGSWVYYVSWFRISSHVDIIVPIYGYHQVADHSQSCEFILVKPVSKILAVFISNVKLNMYKENPHGAGGGSFP